jgi:CRISPR/Cas system-associated exonuclease Cas4 (RecB family)
MSFTFTDRIKTWSPSRLGDYETCPRKAYFKHVKRLKDEGSTQSNRGIELHKAAELYVSGQTNEIHPELRKVTGFLNKYRQGFAEGTVKTEVKLAFTEKWEVCDWMAWNVWLRIVIDITEQLAPKYVQISDWKSGKLKKNDEGYGSQLNLYSVCAISAGWCNEAKAQLIFIDHGVPVERPEGHVIRDILEPAQKYWSDRVARMLTDMEFATNPGWMCNYCPYSRGRGGQCEF